MTMILMRLIAFVIDLQLLGILGFVLNKFFGFNMDHWVGTVYGGIISVILLIIYFSVIESNLFRGRSVGKVLLKLHVVNQNPGLLPFASLSSLTDLKLTNPNIKTALIRSFFKLLPIMVLWIRVPFKTIPLLNITVGDVFELASVALVISYVYQMISTKKLQTPYDMFTKTQVVRLEQPKVSHSVMDQDSQEKN